MAAAVGPCVAVGDFSGVRAACEKGFSAWKGADMAYGTGTDDLKSTGSLLRPGRGTIPLSFLSAISSAAT